MFFVLITDVWALKVMGSNDLYCLASSLGKQVTKDVPGIKNSTCFCLSALATWVQAAQLRVPVAQLPPPVRSVEEDPTPRRRQGALGPSGQAVEPRGDTPWQRPDLGPLILAF